MKMTVFLLVFCFLIANSTDTTATTNQSTDTNKSLTTSQKLKKNLPQITIEWFYLPDNPVPCNKTAGIFLNGKYYQVSGESSGGGDYDFIQIWDGVSWSMSNAAHPGGGLHLHSVTEWEGMIVVSYGYGGGGYYTNTTVYDPSSDVWKESTDAYVSNYASVAIASANGYCYAFGGQQIPTVSDDAFRWTPGDGWMIRVASLPYPRTQACAASYNGIIYLFGGGQTSVWDYRDSIWQYDPNKDEWLIRYARLTEPRRGATAVTVGDAIYIIGGAQGMSEYLTSVDVYYPGTDVVESATPIPLPLAFHAAGGSTNPDQIYISGGETNDTYFSQYALMGTFPYLRIQPTSLGLIKAAFR